jgi:hypothetical protein
MGFKVKTKSRSSQNSSIALIVLMVLSLLGVIGFVVYQLANPPEKSDKKTLCPAKGPLGHLVLLVDKSDPMTFTQRKAFEVLYRQTITAGVPKGHLISVYALGQDFSQTAEPIVELCNPGNASDASDLEQKGLTGNPDQIKKAYDEKYLRPLFAVSEKLVSDKAGNASPILEMVQLVGITGFARQNVGGERRLIIVSDMIHNTPQLSHYQGAPQYDAFFSTAYGKKVRADLRGVKVEIRMLMNTPDIQKPELLRFWMGHVQEGGGRIVLHEPMP